MREAVCLGDRVMLLSPHPGRIREDFRIRLPRPRDVNSIELAEYASRITAALKGYCRGGGGRVRRAALASLFFAALLAVWQIDDHDRALVAGPAAVPGEVGGYLWESLRDGTLLAAIAVTLRRLLVGYAIGLAIGLPLGLLVQRLRVR